MKILVDKMPSWSGDCIFCDEWAQGCPCYFSKEPCALHTDIEAECDFLMPISTDEEKGESRE